MDVVFSSQSGTNFDVRNEVSVDGWRRQTSVFLDFDDDYGAAANQDEYDDYVEYPCPFEGRYGPYDFGFGKGQESSGEAILKKVNVGSKPKQQDKSRNTIQREIKDSDGEDGLQCVEGRDEGYSIDIVPPMDEMEATRSPEGVREDGDRDRGVGRGGGGGGLGWLSELKGTLWGQTISLGGNQEFKADEEVDVATDLETGRGPGMGAEGATDSFDSERRINGKSWIAR